MIKFSVRDINFKGLYYSPDRKFFNQAQLTVADKIAKKLSSPLSGSSKYKSYEDKYKHYGYDFILDPNDRYLDSDDVRLLAVRGLKIKHKGDYPVYKYKESTNIGTYNLNKDFDINDTEFLINKTEKSNFQKLIYFLTVLGISIAATIGIGINSCIQKSAKNINEVVPKYVIKILKNRTNLIKMGL